MKSFALSILLLAACHTSPAPSSSPAPEGNAMEVVPLQHASAETVARLLNDRLSELAGTPSSVRASPDQAGPEALADLRTNSVLIVAPSRDMQGLLDLVARLDSEAP